jgi:hypothetical protein
MAKFVKHELEKWMMPRDREVLVSVHNHGMLNSKQIEYLHFRENKNSKVIALRRLKKLVDGGYLENQWFGWKQYGNMQHFTITNKGAMIVAFSLGIDYEEVKIFRKQDIRNIEHTVLIGDFHIGLIKGGYSVANYTADVHNTVRFKYKLDKVRIEPDGKGEIISPSTNRNFEFLMEMDRGGKSYEEMTNRILKYEKYLLSKAYTKEFINFPIVITVTIGDTRLNKLKTFVEQQKKTNINFLFTTINNMDKKVFHLAGHDKPVTL